MDNIILFFALGFVVVSLIAAVWALFRIASDTFMSMINSGVFNLRTFGWALFCAFLALIPLFFALALRPRFEATFPG